MIHIITLHCTKAGKTGRWLIPSHNNISIDELTSEFHSCMILHYLETQLQLQFNNTITFLRLV